MTTMPQYATYSYGQLQDILRERHLRATGYKAELVTRLRNDDNPFPFLKLPGEIRNKIYKYMAAFEKPVKKGAIKSAVDSRELPYHVCAGDIQNQATIAQPGFFNTCSQIYHESRAFFYRHHEFKLYIWQEPGMKQHSKCLKKMLNWLGTIGVEMQKQIRTLEINLQCDPTSDLGTYIWFVDNLHSMLSDHQATVIYRPISQMRARHDVAFLWGIGKVLQVGNPGRVPQLEHPNWSVRGSPASGNEADVWTWARNPLAYTPRKPNAERPSLTFGPDEGWFGRDVGAGFV